MCSYNAVVKAIREDACLSKAEGPSLHATRTPTPQHKKRKPEPRQLEMPEQNDLDNIVSGIGCALSMYISRLLFFL